LELIIDQAQVTGSFRWRRRPLMSSSLKRSNPSV